MKNVCIKPFDDKGRIMAEALRIVNAFKILGFKTRASFVGVIQDKDSDFKTSKMMIKLWHYWANRVVDDALNQKLEEILDNLKNE